MTAARRLALAALALGVIGPAPVMAAPDEPPAMLLVASPKLDDPRFRESVVLVLRHGRGGPLGVIVNKGSEVTLATVFKKPDDATLAAKPLHFGGPVEPLTSFEATQVEAAQGRSAVARGGAYDRP